MEQPEYPPVAAPLPGFFEPWVLQEREHLTVTYLETLRQLVQAREEGGDFWRWSAGNRV